MSVGISIPTARFRLRSFLGNKFVAGFCGLFCIKLATDFFPKKPVVVFLFVLLKSTEAIFPRPGKWYHSLSNLNSMPTIFGLDIPPGLEGLYYAIFGYPNSANPNVIRVNNTHVPRIRKSSLIGISFLHYCEPFFTALTQTVKDLFTDYWGELPFGTHTGAGNWPGSGFSAFVYYNRQRPKNTFPLFLEPPFNFSCNLAYGFGATGGTFEPTETTLQKISFLHYATSDDEADGTIAFESTDNDVWISGVSLIEDPFGAKIQLVSNRFFDSGLTDWDLSGSADAGFYGGVGLRGGALLSQDVPIVAGRLYLFSFFLQLPPNF